MITELSEIFKMLCWADLSMISALIFLGTLITTIVIMWWRVISNLIDVIVISYKKRLYVKKNEEKFWGTLENSIIALLIAEIIVALVISALIIMVLWDAY